MKKLFLSLCAVFFMTQIAFASDSPLKMGIRLGDGAEWATGDDSKYFADDDVYNAAAFTFDVRYVINPLFSIHPAIGLDVRSYDNDKSGLEESQFILMDLYIPVMARFNLTPGFFLEAGPNFRVNLLAQNYDGLSDSWEDLEQYKTVEFGLGAGVGYTFFFGLELDGRFEYGLTDVVKHTDIGMGRFSINVAYWFIK